MNTENNRKTRKEHLVLINQKFNEVDCLIIDYLNEARRMEANKIKSNDLDKTVEQPAKETVPKKLKLSEIFKAMPYTTNKVGKTFVQSVPIQKKSKKLLNFFTIKKTNMSTPENNTPNQPDNNEKQEEQKQEQPVKASPMISHQRMLSAIVKKGYEGLTDEERAYWNSVY